MWLMIVGSEAKSGYPRGGSAACTVRFPVSWSKNEIILKWTNFLITHLESSDGLEWSTFPRHHLWGRTVQGKEMTRWPRWSLGWGCKGRRPCCAVTTGDLCSSPEIRNKQQLLLYHQTYLDQILAYWKEVSLFGDDCRLPKISSMTATASKVPVIVKIFQGRS